MTDVMLDLLTGAVAVATAGMAAATVYLAAKTRRAVEAETLTAKAAQKEADATLELVHQTRVDRELEVRPVLVTDGGFSATVAGSSTERLNGMLRNIGRGPAVNARVIVVYAGEVFWDRAVSIPSGGVIASQLIERRGIGAVEPALAETCAYCFDQLGNGLRFVLDSGDPPMAWPRGESAPDWAAALAEPFDWRPVGMRTPGDG